MEIIITDNHNRDILNEGRNSGMGFAFLKKESENVFKTVHPLSPCKDYLNDVVFSENTGIPTTKYGLSYEKQDIYDGELFYLAIKIVSAKENQYFYSKNSLEDKILLLNNHKHIQILLNYFESNLLFTTFSTVEKAKDDYFLLSSPINWCISSYTISLFSLLVRLSLVYDGKEDVLSFLNNYSYNKQDTDFIKACLPKIMKILETKILPIQQFNEENARNNTWCPHSLGILSWK